MDWFVGTSGYSYKEWKGTFYPDDLASKDMLSYYADKLTAVEINNTFYRMPKSTVLETWRGQVPESFRFSIKASQRITHKKRLKDAESEMEFLLGNLATLGTTLGVILFQLPPYFKKDLDRLDAFLEELPSASRTVFEFRHESWVDDDVTACLRTHGATTCIVDNDDMDVAPELIATGRVGYLRLRRSEYDDAALAEWVNRIGSQDAWDEVFVFFKHDDDTDSPNVASRFLEQVSAL